MCDKKDSSDLRDDEDELSASDESEPEESLTAVISDPEPDHGDEDEDQDEEPYNQAALAQFSLKGGGSDFSYRTRNIFDCLDKVTPPTSSSTTSTLNQQAPSRKTSQPPLSSPIAAKRKGTPDYLLHPERWTRYSLEGVSETSEQGNAAAAFNFLSELKERKEEQRKIEGKQQQGEEEEEQNHGVSPTCDPQHKMIFSRPNRPRSEAAVTEKSREKETHLSHLQEEQEEEEEKHTESGRETGEDVKKEAEKAAPVFTVRKMRSKNYRRSSEGEEL